MGGSESSAYRFRPAYEHCMFDSRSPSMLRQADYQRVLVAEARRLGVNINLG
ncbi:hypothetical protein BAUCODRAFT_30959 [Baudoinia panamericana UAMH 10762]|uniref:Uncharacterized protein n=1 Tax=Baudoinia panamericana (strain UAMH 10762) TaxID=717646 RepID=M2NHZ1_BAUPA|nr:uncharacterized protein BAUCODRAFT_30959 [Baudoinia panamericana UAMH 10762]EMC98695.1 hypothetical protein BAUCODRAFT_30959 [Baudoinia panamericana UAMH 10762]